MDGLATGRPSAPPRRLLAEDKNDPSPWIEPYLLLPLPFDPPLEPEASRCLAAALPSSPWPPAFPCLLGLTRGHVSYDLVLHTQQREPGSPTSSGSTAASTPGSDERRHRSAAPLRYKPCRVSHPGTDAVPKTDAAPEFDYTINDPSSFSAELPGLHKEGECRQLEFWSG
ncbi:uncharacterized protein LOC125522620 [Triticum urartu]|uniref:uncharacterized protein LOC125522620 n=1 Tax=Triticum urartu TaxID=4572 RepID=UPI002044036E|nr:uncharacterized protein LOC125522620 [Triticum urartu]